MAVKSVATTASTCTRSMTPASHKPIVMPKQIEEPNLTHRV